MSMKRKILNMPAWKAMLCVLFLLFSFGVMFEEVLAHTIFHMFDRVITSMEIQKIEDLADLNDTSFNDTHDYSNDSVKKLIKSASS